MILAVRHVNIKLCQYFQVVFELPVKSESVLSLYRLDLDGENSSGRHKMIETSCKEANSKHFHKQVTGNRRILGQPLTQHSVQQTPPRRRPHRQKRLPVPVLSVESLTTALNCAGVSYLDTGDVCRHGSVPDLKRVFVSDYIWNTHGKNQIKFKWIPRFCINILKLKTAKKNNITLRFFSIYEMLHIYVRDSYSRVEFITGRRKFCSNQCKTKRCFRLKNLDKDNLLFSASLYTNIHRLTFVIHDLIQLVSWRKENVHISAILHYIYQLSNWIIFILPSTTVLVKPSLLATVQCADILFFTQC